MAAFVTDNATKLSAALLVLIALVFVSWDLNSSGVELVLAVGVVSLYQGNVDLLRVFYVLSGVLAAIDIIALLIGHYKKWNILLAIIRILGEAAAVWFGYQVGVEHSDAMDSSGAQGLTEDAAQSPSGGALI